MGRHQTNNRQPAIVRLRHSGNSLVKSHPTTLTKPTSRFRETAVAGLNEALLAKAAGTRLLRTARVRADTTAIPGNVTCLTGSRLLAKAVGKAASAVRRMQAAGGARGPAGPGDRRQAARLTSSVDNPVMGGLRIRLRSSSEHPERRFSNSP
jgi:hypothetical protein